MGDAKKALGKRNQDREAALKAHAKAVKAYEGQKEWRAQAETQVRADLTAYIDGIKGTIGARSQDSLTRDQALYLASCTADHKDLSLNF